MGERRTEGGGPAKARRSRKILGSHRDEGATTSRRADDREGPSTIRGARPARVAGADPRGRGLAATATPRSPQGRSTRSATSTCIPHEHDPRSDPAPGGDRKTFHWRVAMGRRAVGSRGARSKTGSTSKKKTRRRSRARQRRAGIPPRGHDGMGQVEPYLAPASRRRSNGT